LALRPALAANCCMENPICAAEKTATLSTNVLGRAKQRLAVIAIATSLMRMVAVMLPRCARRHKLGIQTYKGREGRQSATLF
jgi:hypothetical protein